MNVDTFSNQVTKRSQLPDYVDSDDELEGRGSKRKRTARSPSPPKGSLIPNSEYFQIKMPGQNSSGSSLNTSHAPNTSSSSASSEFIVYRSNKSNKELVKSNEKDDFRSSSSHRSASRRSEPYDIKRNHSNADKWNERNFKSSNTSRDKSSSFTSLTSEMKSNESYKSKFLRLVSSQRKAYEKTYKTRVSVEGQVFISDEFKTANEAEENAYMKAYLALEGKTSSFACQTKLSDSPFATSSSKTTLVNELKKIFEAQGMQTLFKTEFPAEYKRMFGKVIPNDWYETVCQSSFNFKIDESLGRNMITITLQQ